MSKEDMRVEFGALGPTDLDKLRTLLGYSFIQPSENVQDWIPDDFPCEWVLAGYAGENLATCTAILPMEIVGRRRREKVGGVSGVATDPHYRGFGLAKELMAASTERMRRQKMRWALLYPFDFDFYERLGWGQGAPLVRMSIGKGRLPFKKSASGGYRWLKENEWRVLDDIHKQWALLGSGALSRSERTWRQMMSRPKRERFTVLWESEENKGEGGYIIYDLMRGQDTVRDDSRLLVIDWAWSSSQARAALLGYMAFHSGQVGRIDIKVRDDDPLTNLEGEGVTSRFDRGPMVRVIDVEEFLGKEDHTGEKFVLVRIVDELCPWNDGVYRLSAARCGPVGRKQQTTPDAILSIGAFSSLVWGSLSLDTAISCGMVGGPKVERLEILRNCLPARAPFFLDWF